jgi:hypothetical protein
MLLRNSAPSALFPVVIFVASAMLRGCCRPTGVKCADHCAAQEAAIATTQFASNPEPAAAYITRFYRNIDIARRAFTRDETAPTCYQRFMEMHGLRRGVA